MVSSSGKRLTASLHHSVLRYLTEPLMIAAFAGKRGSGSITPSTIVKQISQN